MSEEERVIDWFIGNHSEPPKHADGSVDFEALCGEFIVEGELYETVRKHYDALPSHLKREIHPADPHCHNCYDL